MTVGPGARLHHPRLESSDLDASGMFYTRALGFTVRKQEAFRHGRQLVVTRQGFGLTEGREPGGQTVDHIRFAVEDVDGLTLRVRDAGYVVARGLGAGAYGHTVYVVGPDGNEIELVELSEETE